MADSNLTDEGRDSLVGHVFSRDERSFSEMAEYLLFDWHCSAVGVRGALITDVSGVDVLARMYSRLLVSGFRVLHVDLAEMNSSKVSLRQWMAFCLGRLPSRGGRVDSLVGEVLGKRDPRCDIMWPMMHPDEKVENIRASSCFDFVFVESPYFLDHTVFTWLVSESDRHHGLVCLVLKSRDELELLDKRFGKTKFLYGWLLSRFDSLDVAEFVGLED